MNLDELLLGLGLVIVLWLLGQRLLAGITLVILLVVLILFREEKQKKKAPLGGIEIKGPVEVLEPIVIETKKKPPFRIPSEINAVIQAKGYKEIDREKYSTKLFFNLAKLALVLLGVKKKKKSE